MKATEKQSLRLLVFWPPFLLLFASVVLSLLFEKSFLATVVEINNWILQSFGWLFNVTSLLMLLLCVAVWFSPLAKVKIGGEQAQPLLDRWKWFSITLCTTVAIGILFWATAEPMYHLHSPPKGMNFLPNSLASTDFALSTMFLHWSFTPYAIYSVAALTFALVYYNQNRPFSLSSTLMPLFGHRICTRFSSLIDSICLFTLVVGMAASLGTGALTLLGVLTKYAGVESNSLTIGLVTLLIVASFIASAASGLMKGIRILSDINAKIFFGLCLFVFIFGPTTFILKSGGHAFIEYATSFFDKSLFGINGDVDWANSWTTFYWANWMAWAPITALFLGRISYGYTVRQFLTVNLIAPAIFGCLWMSVFSGAAIRMDQLGAGSLYQSLKLIGPESVVYTLIEKLPWAPLITALFVFATYLSYVTAADSNTEAMGGISTSGISLEMPSPPIWIKVVWGSTIGAVAWVMVCFAGIDGMKMLSNLGGLPALFLIILMTFSLVRLVFTPELLSSSAEE